MQDLAEIRTGLTTRLDYLVAQIERIEAEQRAPVDDDLSEQAIEREDDEVLDGTERAAYEEIKAIRQALTRLDAGRYGLCVSCREPIAEERLKAFPAAALCISCARDWDG